MKHNGIDWKPTGIDYLYEHPNKKLYLSRIAYMFNNKRKFKTYKHKETDLRRVKKTHNALVVEVANPDYKPTSIIKGLEAQQETDKLNITPDKTLEQCINILEPDSTPDIVNQIKAFRKHVAPLPLYKKPLQDIKFSDLMTIKSALDKAKVKTPTYISIQSLISKCFSRAELYNQFQHFSTSNPFKSELESKVPLIKYVNRYAPKNMTALNLAKGMYKEILSITDIDTKRTVLLAFLLSKRINEIKSIKRKDIDLTTNTVMITISKRRVLSEPQEFPLPKEVIPLLKGLKDDDYISYRRSKADRPYSPTAKAIISNVTGMPLASLKGYAIHDVRSVALQTLIDDNYDEVKAERVLLDHVTGKVSSHYKATTLTERQTVYSHYWKLIGAVKDTSTSDKVDEVNLSEFKIKFIK